MLSAPVARTPSRDLALAACFSSIAGFSNAAALRSAGLFSGNVTGNVSLAADKLAFGAWAASTLFVAVAVSFGLGAFGCSRLAARARRMGSFNPAPLCVGAEAIAMAVLAITCMLMEKSMAALALCSGLAFLMGAQNALASMLTASRVRATHLSGIFTDLGMEFSALVDSKRASSGAAEAAGLRASIALRLATIACFFFGGAAGALAWSTLGPLELLTPAAALGIIARAGSVRMPR